MLKRKAKRILSAVMAFVMTFSILSAAGPAVVDAAEIPNISSNGVTVLEKELSSAGGTVEVL